MTETADVIRFKAGDTVPDWILIIEPSPGGGRAKMVFDGDTTVIDSADCIFVIPLSQGTAALAVVGSGRGHYMAESKAVRVATQQTRFLPVRPLPLASWSKPSAWWRRFWPF